MDNWVCLECNKQYGNRRPHTCTCGSKEIENIG